MLNKPKFNLRRVDVQVILLTTLIVIVSCVTLNNIVYNLAYKDMIHSLEERVIAIVNYVESESFDVSTFDSIDSKSDIMKKEYIETKELFSEIRILTNAQYLYTAKLNTEGQMIYVIDGLPFDSSDFRYPGDLIEENFQMDLEKALAGEIIMPEHILNTEWGDVFVSYYPIHNQSGEIVGVIGVEFPAEFQYNTFKEIRMVTPIIIALACIFGALVSVIYFRRISNPKHKDLSNTDYLTSLKSRNAYEIDIQNRIVQKTIKNLGMIMIDLDRLKYVNDTMGHDCGDLYIKTFATVVMETIDKNQIAYRLGGDEFLILVEGATEEKCEWIIEIIESEFVRSASTLFENPSCSCGYCICLSTKKEDLVNAQQKADEMMYKNKKNKKIRVGL